jgi:uncharacterized protein (TIGR00661 family)
LRTDVTYAQPARRSNIRSLRRRTLPLPMRGWSTLLGMRLLYGVVGEGMGHATRSKVTIDWLLSKGHHLKVVVSNRAYQFLDKTYSAAFPRTADAPEGTGAIDVVEIVGLTMKYVDNAFDEGASVVHNVLKVPGLVVENVGVYYEEVVRFRPQAVLSDFDSFAYLFAKVHRLPILSIDNQQVLQRCEIPEEAKELDRSSFLATKAFVKAKLPGCERYVITGFFYPEIREKYLDRTVLVPPILRSAILAAKPTPVADAKHFLVYQTSKSDTTLIPTLQSLSEHKFVVYGLGRDEQAGNCTLKPFSEDGFVADLAAARGVLSNGGLSLLNESVSLHKPVFSVPVGNQYEQLLNAYYIKHLGYGDYADAMKREAIASFVARIASFADRVATFRHDSNQKLYATVGATLDEFEARAFHHELRHPPRG